jgi:hypothetical protein
VYKAKQRRNPVNASLTTITAAATSIVAIMLMIPSSYFVAGTEEQGEINAYG